MSSDPPTAVPSPGAENPDAARALAALLRARGAPLLEALDAHQRGAAEHAEGTASFALAAAAALGLEPARREVIAEAARLHEIGQIYVAAEVLAKRPGERDAAEASAFEAHFEAGYRLARGAGIPEPACGWLLRARERYDGSGPESLAGEAIALESRLIAAACECQSELAAESGGSEAPVPRAIAALEAGSGTALDPRIATALVAVLARIGADEAR